MKRRSLLGLVLASGVVAGLVLGGSYLTGQVKPHHAVPQEVSSYRDVVKKVLPAVVSIEQRFKPVARSKSSGSKQQSEDVRKYFKDFSFPG